MEETFAKIEELSAHVMEYVNNRIARVKLGAAEKSSTEAANIIAVTIAVVILSLFLLFGSVALAYALSKWTGEIY